MWGTIRVLFAMAMTAAAVVINSTISTWATEVDLLLALAADVSRSVDQQKFCNEKDTPPQSPIRG